MKKISFIISAALAAASVFTIAPAQAEQQKAIAIIDASFDSKLISGDVVDVCVVSKFVCDSTPQLKNSRQYAAYNHGTIMADIVRANNPNAKLFLITAGTDRAGVVNSINFNEAIKWVNANNKLYNITSVSFSYNAGIGRTCLPKATGVNVRTLHADIVSTISELKSEGTSVYAASGNYASGNNIDYPACIQDVVAVGSSLWRGSQARSDIIVSGLRYTSSNLKSSVRFSQDASEILLSGPHAIAFSYTTSVTTAIVAATN
jgi:hypothetical protein